MTASEQIAIRMARSDATFDGRNFDHLGRADKNRYLERSRSALIEAQLAINEHYQHLLQRVQQELIFVRSYDPKVAHDKPLLDDINRYISGIVID